MKTITWVEGADNWRGIVERPVPDKWMYHIVLKSDKYFVLVDTTGRAWDIGNLDFTSLEDAKRWCEAHWMTVGFMG